ncbi:MAG: PA14 domain-containing protein [Nannocystales bacterium]
MSDQPEPADADRALDARREGLAALAIVSDPNCLPRQAAAHIAQGWALFRGDSDDGLLSAWLRDRFAGSPKPKKARDLEARTRSVEFVEAWEAGRIPADLGEDAARALIKVLLDAAPESSVGAAPTKTRFGPLSRRAVLTLGGVVALGLIALRPWTYEGVGQWHGAYFPGKDFRGEPDTRREADVDFAWGILPPTDSIPADRFAARWTTCLNIEEDVDASFMLIADDGARLLVDRGEPVIDLWEPPEDVEMPFSHGREYSLDAGVHLIEVEYREEGDEAEVHLLATFDQDIPPGPLPSSMLDFPGEDFDEDNPCGNL